MENLIICYYYENQIASIPIGKLEKILRDNDYASKYKLKNEPTDEFKKLVMECIDTISIEALSNLYKYVIKDWKITDFVLENDK